MPSGLSSCASDISPRPPAQYRVSTVAARIAYGKHFGNCQFFRGNGDLVENASATRARAPGAAGASHALCRAVGVLLSGRISSALTRHR